MKKSLYFLLVSFLMFVTSCGSGVQAPQEAADEYCELIMKVVLATPDESKKLLKEVEEFENKIETEHKGDETWFQEFETKMDATCL